MKGFVLLLLFAPAYLFSQSLPVILRVASQDQHDTLGYHLVTALTSEVYKLITDRQVKLWDSPEKEIQITPASIRQIEISSGVSFTSQDVIFIYENWDKTRSGIHTQTVGFKFSARNERNEEVSFGFLDYEDVRHHFMKTRIPTNPNGNYEITYAYALLKKQFAFHLLQFGNKTITAGGVSRDILRDFVGKLSFNPTITVYDYSEKRIEYRIHYTKVPADERSIKTNALLASIETFLQNNEEVFYNAGGDKIMSYIKKGNIRVTRLEVTEHWKSYRKSIMQETRNLRIYVNDSALNRIEFADFLLWGVQAGDASMYEIFKDKDFHYTLYKINDADIPRKEAHLYLKALLTYDWNKITEYVKHY